MAGLHLFAAKPGARFVRMWLETYLEYKESRPSGGNDSHQCTFSSLTRPWYKLDEHPVRPLLTK